LLPRGTSLRSLGLSVSKRNVDVEEIMSRSDGPRASLDFINAATTVATAAFLTWAPAAAGQDVATGQRIWTEKAGCPQCHGWPGTA
jgi:hypothetical protein